MTNYRNAVRIGSLLLGVSALGFAGSLLAPSDALAARKKPQPQGGGGFFSFFEPAPVPQPKPRNYRMRPAQPGAPNAIGAPVNPLKAATKPAGPSAPAIKGPVIISVSLAQQRLRVYDIDGQIAEAPISSGTRAFPTLTGVFSILEKSVVHHSNLYDGAPMPNMQRLTWSGTAMHAGDLPGYPASHGCIRLPYNFSKQFYGMTKLNDRVIVSQEPVVPAAFSHPKLPVPLPPEDQEIAGKAGTKVAEFVDYESVRALAFISKAKAADTVTTSSTTSSEPLTGYRAKRAEERKATEDALATALTAKVDLEAAAKAAVQAADEAKAAAKNANIEASNRAQDAKRAEQARAAGDQAIEAFERKYASAGELSADVYAKAAETEQQLEDKTFELGRNVEATREAAKATKAAATEADAAAVSAAGKVKEEAQKLAKANQEIKTAQTKIEGYKREDAYRKFPVSVLISRSAGRLFIRQGHQQIFDMPVTFKEPTAAIGTHVYTALERTGKTDMRWNVLSIPYNANAPLPDASKNKKNGYEVKPVSTHLPQTPDAALDRVDIPEEARERIEDMLKPGSSIIISDYGISHQTGPFSDFILLTR